MFGVDAVPAALVGAALVTLGYAGNRAGDAGRSCDNILYGAVVAGILPVQCGQACKLHIDSGHGRIHIRNTHHHHTMQVPKLYGAGAGTGELFELGEHIAETIEM